MKTRTILGLAAVAGLAAGASAQVPSFTSDTNVTFSFSFSDNGAGNGNNNGVLDNGETALISVDEHFTNQGSTANFSPAIGPFSSGTLLGFGSGFLDLNGTGGTVGTFNDSTPLANNAGTSGYGVKGRWRIAAAASNGVVNAASDGISTLQMGQFAATPDSAISDNPVTSIFRFLWTPSSYTSRNVSFGFGPSPVAGNAAVSVYLDLGNGTGASVFVSPNNINFGSVSFAVAPAPGSLALLGLGGLVAGRRRRSR